MEDVEIRQIRTIVDHRSWPKMEEFSVTTRTNSYRNIEAHRYRWSRKSSLVRPSWIVSYSFMCIFAPCRRHAALLEAWILGNLTRPRLAEPWAAFPSVSLTRPFARSRRFDPSLLTIRSWIALLFVQVSHLPETKRLSFFGLHFRTVNANYDDIDYYASYWNDLQRNDMHIYTVVQEFGTGIAPNKYSLFLVFNNIFFYLIVKRFSSYFDRILIVFDRKRNPSFLLVE